MGRLPLMTPAETWLMEALLRTAYYNSLPAGFFRDLLAQARSKGDVSRQGMQMVLNMDFVRVMYAVLSSVCISALELRQLIESEGLCPHVCTRNHERSVSSLLFIGNVASPARTENVAKAHVLLTAGVNPSLFQPWRLHPMRVPQIAACSRRQCVVEHRKRVAPLPCAWDPPWSPLSRHVGVYGVLW
jgi:hypothetical protein